jgi:hypothetical protein
MVNAPFKVIQQENTDRCQAPHTKWYVGCLRLNRYRTISKSTVTVWGFVRDNYIGSMLLSYRDGMAVNSWRS